MIDELSGYNKERWDELARSGVEFSRPWLDLDDHAARERIDPYGILNEIAGKDVLCLASGGGQQSAAFGVLGAQVTVFDLSETQLEQDRVAAAHYHIPIQTIQGDIRDLSPLKDDAFDIVYEEYSLEFVPDVRLVFQEIRRVIRPGGFYYLGFGNPFIHSTVDEEAWDGESYPLKYAYIDGEETTHLDPKWGYWDVETRDGRSIEVEGPKEYRHTLSTLLNSLIGQGFVILGIWEALSGDLEAEPGSWEHFQAFAPPFLKLWARYRPEAFE
jgi:ubiquinone/menaquinone biosynthesis C-methylase UbiE